MRPEMELEHKFAKGGGGIALAADNVVGATPACLARSIRAAMW